MNYLVAADTDVGIVKETNQDSVCVMTAQTELGPVVLALIADGMGGLSKGELASATVTREFMRWFENTFPSYFSHFDWQQLSNDWDRKLKEINLKILEYGQQNYVKLGTTFSGMLFVGDECLLAHIGDSRVYLINTEVKQLTQDHTVVAREILRGNLTVDEAEKDPRKNVLLQCIGASRTVMPDIAILSVVPDSTYLICSDGFRHMITSEEFAAFLDPTHNNDEKDMQRNLRYLIDIAKKRAERDNISAVLIKTIRQGAQRG